MTDSIALKPSIDLNADLGEGFPWDAELLGRVTSANVCCGAHAGDSDSIRETLRIAKANGVVVGAHPGYPDRENFGRKAHAIGAEDVRALVLEQVSALCELADPLGIEIRYIKPHGALYNQAQDDSNLAQGVVEAAHARGLPVVGLPGSHLEVVACQLGVRFVAEGFVDRGYDDRGRLLPRSAPDSVHHLLPAIETQTLAMVGGLRAHASVYEGGARNRSERVSWHASWMRVETLCIHGDRKEALAIADAVRAILSRNGVAVRAFC